MGRTDEMVARLRSLQAAHPGITALAIVSSDGLSIASTLPGGNTEDRLSAMSAAMLALGDRVAEELGRGAFEQVLIGGEQGFVALMSMGEKAVLAAVADQHARPGLVLLDMRRALEDLRQLM